MISLTSVLLLLSANAVPGAQNLVLKPVPTGVILSGAGDNPSYAPLMGATAKIGSLRHFEKFDDDLLASKLGDSSFIFVKKNFPPYKRLRLRKHVINLLVKTGYGQPFAYQDLATAEFEPYIRSIWRNTPQIVPSPDTKLAFFIVLQSSTTVRGEALDFNFVPSVKLSDQTQNALISYPPKVLQDKSEISERARSLVSIDSQCQYSLLKETPVSAGLGLVRDALENFQIYYEVENEKLNSSVEALLTDPVFNDTKARRKIKDMRELKEKIPAAFNTILGIRKEELSYTDQVPSTEDTLALSEASLKHQYVVDILGFANGKKIHIRLPI